MDDKLFELMSKMYSELTIKIDGLGNELKEVKNEVKQNSKDIQKIQIKIENSVEPKIQLALEKLDSVNVKLTEHDARFDAIESKIESQDVEIKVLKRVK